MLTENDDIDAIRSGLRASVSHLEAPPDLLSKIRQRHSRHQRAAITSVLAVVLFVSGLAIGSETLGRTQVTQFKHVDLSQYSATASSIPSTERVSTTIVLRQGQLTISPAPNAENPAVSQQAALATWLAMGLPGSGGAQPSSVLFGLLTDKEYAAIQPNGSTSPIYAQHPTWVIEYRNAQVPLTGGYVPGPTDPHRPQFSVGPLYGFIDAASGTYMYSVSQTVAVASP